MLLWIKMLRDLKNNAVQFFSVFIMSFLALLMMAGFSSTNLDAIDEYFADINYKDIDIRLENMTYNTADDIRNIDGVETVSCVMNTTGKTSLPQGDFKMCLSFISDNEVSKMYLVQGQEYVPGSEGVWIDDVWAKAQNISVGDVLDIRVGDVTISETVKGTVYSPEYLYYVPDSTYLEPVYGEFGFGIMDISRAPSKEIVFDQLLVKVEGIEETINSSKKDIDKMNAMAESIRSVLDNKLAVVVIKTDIDQAKYYRELYDTFESIGMLFPGLFALIAILGIISTMSRVISSQRTTIGALKALGFTTRKIMFHYMSYSVFIVFIGGLLGSIAGYLLLGPINYNNMVYYYMNPYERTSFSFSAVVFLFGLTAVGGLIGYLCNKKLLKKSASQILQPEAPKGSKQGWYETLKIWDKIKFGTKWNIRDVSRNKLRTAIGLLGVTVCSLLLFLALGYDEAVNYSMKWSYGMTMKSRNKILIEEGTPYETSYEYAREYKGQMVQTSTATAYLDDETVKFNVMVYQPGSCYALTDVEGNPMELPKSGAYVTEKFDYLYDVKIGDFVKFKVDGEEQECKVRITGYCKDPVNQGIVFSEQTYRDINQTFTPDSIYTNMKVDRSIVDRPEIASVNSMDELIATEMNQKESLLMYVAVLISMGVVLGVVVQYNLGTMSFNEKYKDMAALKVLGFMSKDLKVLMLQQNVAIAVVGGILGVIAGKAALKPFLYSMEETDDFLIKLTMLPFSVALIGTFVVTLVVNSFIISKIDNIELAAALKS